ncbi:hypothetical protein Chls_218 [Chlamydia suis]|uniref:Uncharacterized protein n=1 Tax=Chlamydia suis TaxID=83559 RepID=A0ABX6IQB5_9CHLA|nr:hypothetical protein Chls_218 [Chlamydia suis]
MQMEKTSSDHSLHKFHFLIKKSRILLSQQLIDQKYTIFF